MKGVVALPSLRDALLAMSVAPFDTYRSKLEVVAGVVLSAQ